jgi:predicted regulator of amino acid metabolism with ACT domain
MIKVFIFLLLIIIVIFSIGILINTNRKEGYQNRIMNNDENKLLLTELDKNIMLVEIVDNIINHEKLLNVFDNTYPLSNIQINPNAKFLDIFIILIPVLQKQDQEILKLKKNYVLAGTIRSLFQYISENYGIPDEDYPITLNSYGKQIPIVYNSSDKDIAVFYNLKQVIDYHDMALQSISNKAANYIKSVYGIS